MGEGDEFYLKDEESEWIGLKKSEYLSKLIESQSSQDFSFEEFHQFDQLIPQTLEEPDRSFRQNDDQYEVRVYTRTYSSQEVFHQVVIGAVFPDKKTGTEVLVPILAFVSRMDELVRIFCVGTVMDRPTLN